MKLYFNTKSFDAFIEDDMEITKDIAEAELIVMGSKTVDFNAAVNAKAVYRFGVGRENIPAAVIEKNDPVVYFPSEETKKILFDSTANFTVYIIMYMLYNSSIGEIEGWKKCARKYVANKNLLVIGTGNIGGKVVGKMKPILNVMTYDAMQNKPEELNDMLKKADVISLHIPSNDKTKGFINAENMKLMKDDVIIVNTARGPIVDEDALYDRLQNTNMRAAFDVYWVEPYDGKLKSLGKDKFFMTPHTSSQTIEYVAGGFRDIKNIMEKHG